MSNFGSRVAAVAALSSAFIGGCGSPKPVVSTPDNINANVTAYDRKTMLVAGDVKFMGIEPYNIWDGSKFYLMRFEVSKNNGPTLKCNYVTSLTEEKGTPGYKEAAAGAFNGEGLVEGQLLTGPDGSSALVIESLSDIRLYNQGQKSNPAEQQAVR